MRRSGSALASAAGGPCADVPRREPGGGGPEVIALIEWTGEWRPRAMVPS